MSFDCVPLLLGLDALPTELPGLSKCPVDHPHETIKLLNSLINVISWTRKETRVLMGVFEGDGSSKTVLILTHC